MLGLYVGLVSWKRQWQTTSSLQPRKKRMFFWSHQNLSSKESLKVLYTLQICRKKIAVHSKKINLPSWLANIYDSCSFTLLKIWCLENSFIGNLSALFIEFCSHLYLYSIPFGKPGNFWTMKNKGQTFTGAGRKHGGSNFKDLIFLTNKFCLIWVFSWRYSIGINGSCI